MQDTGLQGHASASSDKIRQEGQLAVQGILAAIAYTACLNEEQRRISAASIQLMNTSEPERLYQRITDALGSGRSSLQAPTSGEGNPIRDDLMLAKENALQQKDATIHHMKNELHRMRSKMKQLLLQQQPNEWVMEESTPPTGAKKKLATAFDDVAPGRVLEVLDVDIRWTAKDLSERMPDAIATKKRNIVRLVNPSNFKEIPADSAVCAPLGLALLLEPFRISLDSSLAALKKVGDKFLYGCCWLEAIENLGSFSSVQEVGYSFLGECSALKEFDLRPLTSLREIGSNFLYSCSSLKELDLRPLAAIHGVGHGFLENCCSLQRLDLRPLSHLQELGYSFLHGCSSLKELDLRPLAGVMSVGGNFLCSCYSLKTLDLSPLRQLRVVGKHFLSGCSGMKVIDLSPLESVEEVGDYFLSECASIEQLDLTALAKVRKIGNWFLYECYKLQTLNLSPLVAVREVGYAMLFDCLALRDVVVGERQLGVFAGPLTEGRLRYSVVV